MQILYILSQKPGNTGSGVYLKHITEEAIKTGIDIRVIVGITEHSDLNNISHIPEDLIFPVVFGKDTDVPIAGMSDIMPYESIKFSEFNETMYNNYCNAFLKVFERCTFNWVPDIVHSNHLWIVTALAKQYFQNTPVVASCHGTALRQKVLAPKIEKKIFQYLRKTDKIFALTENQKKSIVEWLKIDENKIFVTGSGYANDIFCLTDKKKFINRKIFKIIYAGKVSYSKGVPYLIEAFKRLDKELLKKTELFIVGDYNNKEGMEIRKLAQKYSNIIFLGKLEQSEVAEKFKDSHLFVLPSFFEGLPLVVIESLACGCAAIITRLPDIETWLHSDLADNDVIKFIPLPKLKSIDEPHEHEIDNFIENLKKTVEYYAYKFFQNDFPDTLKFIKYLSEHSFENLFKRIYKVYEELIL
jgi:glycosyltransferase involved in cell wall biosynthesis